MAERGKFQKGIEETVTQLKAQLDDSQSLINQTPLNLSLTEPRTENYSIHSTSEELFNILLNKDRKIAELSAKMQKLEANVLDLQENVKEKDSVIDARTKAITLMTESLSKKGKNTLDALDDTKEQMRKMQENFVNLEMEMKADKQRLIDELKEKNNDVEQIQQSYNNLQKEFEEYKSSSKSTTQGDIQMLNERIKELEKINATLLEKSTETEDELLLKELEEKNKVIERLQEENKIVEQSCIDLKQQVESLNNVIEDYKTDSDSKTLDNEIEALKKQVAELEQQNSELQKPLTTTSRDSPQRSSKKGKKGQKQKTVDSNETRIVELQKIIDDTKSELETQRAGLAEHQLTISELNLIIEELKSSQESEKHTQSTDQTIEEITKLKKQLDDSNKNMIKIKAQHKSKLKELNKKIEDLKKNSNGDVEITKLQTENSKLIERIDMLEEQKASLGLDADNVKGTTFVILNIN